MDGPGLVAPGRELELLGLGWGLFTRVCRLQPALRSGVQGPSTVLGGTGMQEWRCRLGDVGRGLVTVFCCRLVTGKLLCLDA